MSEYSIDRCSLNVFNGTNLIQKYGINLCNLNSATGNTCTPYDVCPAIWNKNSLKQLFETFPNETYTSSELNSHLHTFCKNKFKCYGQQKSADKIYYCLGRPYLNGFKILFITIKKEITFPVDVYMDMKEDFIYYFNKYKLRDIIQINNSYAFIINNFRKL
jgi:hypothetical protein